MSSFLKRSISRRTPGAGKGSVATGTSGQSFVSHSLTDLCVCAQVPVLHSAQRVPITPPASSYGASLPTPCASSSASTASSSSSSPNTSLIGHGRPFGCTLHPWQVSVYTTTAPPNHPHPSSGGGVGVALTFLRGKAPSSRKARGGKGASRSSTPVPGDPEQADPPSTPTLPSPLGIRSDQPQAAIVEQEEEGIWSGGQLAVLVTFLLTDTEGHVLIHRQLSNMYGPETTATWGFRNLLSWDHLNQESAHRENGLVEVRTSVRILEAQGGWLDVSRMERDARLQDVGLRSQDGDILGVARVALVARSQYFRDLFLSSQDTTTVDVYDVDERTDTLTCLIHYAYTGRVDAPIGDYPGLYAAADRLRFPDLQALLTSRMTANLTLDLALAMIPLAWRHSDAVMQGSILRVLHRHRSELAENDTFARLIGAGGYADVVQRLMLDAE